MESALDAYRRKKRVETLKSDVKNQIKSKMETVWSSLTGFLTSAVLPEAPTTNSISESEDTDNRNESLDTLTGEDRPVVVGPSKRFVRVELILKFLIWAFLYIGFLKIGFGAIFFIVSAFWLIWKNLRSEPRSQNEPSAYSVFNPNCEALDGTLKAEHLEKQLLFR